MTMNTYSLANRMRNNKFPEPFLEKIYPTPKPYRTIGEWCVLHHEDLPALTDLELSVELSCVWRRLTLEQPNAAHWLWQRREAVFAEQNRRRGERRSR
jgi:hypothetical protein